MEFGILDCFMISFVCGIVFGLVYEFFRVVRRLFPLGIIIMICDISFFITAGFFVFELSMYLGNYVRLYTLLGFAGGLYAYIQTIGRLFSMLENAIIRPVISAIGSLFANINNSIGVFAHKVASVFSRFHDFSNRHKKSATSLLHFNTKRVYNIKRNIMASGENIGGNNVIQVKIRRSK